MGSVTVFSLFWPLSNLIFIQEPVHELKGHKRDVFIYTELVVFSIRLALFLSSFLLSPLSFSFTCFLHSFHLINIYCHHQNETQSTFNNLDFNPLLHRISFSTI